MVTAITAIISVIWSIVRIGVRMSTAFVNETTMSLLGIFVWIGSVVTSFTAVYNAATAIADYGETLWDSLITNFLGMLASVSGGDGNLHLILPYLSWLLSFDVLYDCLTTYIDSCLYVAVGVLGIGLTILIQFSFSAFIAVVKGMTVSALARRAAGFVLVRDL